MQTQIDSAFFEADLQTVAEAFRFVGENLVSYQLKPELAGCALLVISDYMRLRLMAEEQAGKAVA